MASRRHWVDRYWFPLCAIAIIVGSDYKYRTRSTTQSIGGTPDLAILLELGIYALVGLYLLARHASPPRAMRVPAPVLMSLFYLFTLALSVSYTPFRSFGAVRVWEMSIVIGLAMAAAFQAERAHMHRFAHAFLILVAVSVLYGIAVPSTPVSKLQEGRFTWLAIHPNVSGIFVGIAVVVAAIYLYWTPSRASRPGPHWPPGVYGVIFAIVLYGLIATKTRAAVLGAIIGLLVMLWFAMRGRRRIELISALVISGIGVYIAAAGVIATYFARGESAARLASLNARTDLWSSAWVAILEQPLWGHGVGSTRGIFLDSIGLGGAHNAVINVLVDLGFVGCAVWLGVILTLVVTLLRFRSPDPSLMLDRALLLAIIAFLMTDGFFVQEPGDVTNVGSTWLYMSVAWSVVLSRAAQQRRRRVAATLQGRPVPEAVAGEPYPL